MRYDITAFKADIEFIDTDEEDIDERMLRYALERQVAVSLGLDKEKVYVSPFEVTKREVVRCDFCETDDDAATKEKPAWYEGRLLEHVCSVCRSKYPELETA